MYRSPQAIAVSELLKKADPVTAPKLTVVHHAKPYEDEATHWVANQVVRALQEHVKELEVAQVVLPTYRLLDNVSNDPNSKRFSAEDQLPLIWTFLKSSDVVLLATSECCGFPDAGIVRLSQRLMDMDKEARANDEAARLFKRGYFATLVVGTERAPCAAMMLAQAFSAFGLSLVRDGLVCWHEPNKPVYKSTDLAANLERLARDIGDLCLCR